MNECHAAVMAAREQLCDLTPLLTDCGALCDAACCHSDADGQGGVYLFPGEETLYAGVPLSLIHISVSKLVQRICPVTVFVRREEETGCASGASLPALRALPSNRPPGASPSPSDSRYAAACLLYTSENNPFALPRPCKRRA